MRRTADLLGALTAKTVDFDMEMWRYQDSSCLLCNTPIGLGDGAEWPADPRLLLCWGCMSELCSELIGKLEAPQLCPHCGSGLLWSEDRGPHCDGCDDFNPETDLPND